MNFGVNFFASHGYAILTHLSNLSSTSLKNTEAWNCTSHPLHHLNFCSEKNACKIHISYEILWGSQGINRHNPILYPWLYLFSFYLFKLIIFTVIKIICRDLKVNFHLDQLKSARAKILIPCTLPEQILILRLSHNPSIANSYQNSWRRHSTAWRYHGGHTLPEGVCYKIPLSHSHSLQIIHFVIH